MGLKSLGTLAATANYSLSYTGADFTITRATIVVDGGESGTGHEGGESGVRPEDEEGRAPGVGFCGCRGEDGRLQDAASGRTGGSGVEEVSDKGAVGEFDEALVVAAGGAGCALGEGKGA